MLSTSKTQRIEAWLAVWGWDVESFLDYCEAAIDEETDVGQRFELRAQLDGLRDALKELAGVTP